MDELDLIRQFRAQDAAPNPLARSAARERLIAHEEAAQRSDPRPRRPRRWRVAWPAAGSLAAAAAAVAVLVVAGPESSRTVEFNAQGEGGAASALELVAVAAGQASSTGPLRSGERFYTRTRTQRARRGAGFRFVEVSLHETWRDAGGAGQVTTRGVSTRFPSVRDRARWLQAGSPPLLPRPSKQTFPAGRGFVLAPGLALSATDIAKLPTTPGPLYDWLAQAAEPRPTMPVEDQVATAIVSLLAEAPTPSPVRAALYRALTRVRGVTFLGQAADDTGRAGVAVRFETTRTRLTLIVDPATSQVLARRESTHDGSLITSTTFEKSAVRQRRR